VLSGLLHRNEHPAARVVIALPRFTTYENLARRTVGPLTAARIEIWLVTETGAVEGVSPSS
jgi:hypothetical protein